MSFWRKVDGLPDQALQASPPHPLSVCRARRPAAEASHQRRCPFPGQARLPKGSCLSLNTCRMLATQANQTNQRLRREHCMPGSECLFCRVSLSAKTLDSRATLMILPLQYCFARAKAGNGAECSPAAQVLEAALLLTHHPFCITLHHMQQNCQHVPNDHAIQINVAVNNDTMSM